MFVQLQNSFPEELKRTKQKIRSTNEMEDIFVIKKRYKMINIAIVESKENIYYVTR